MKSISRCALPIVLALAAGPSLAFSESLVCYAIRRGDTATRLAQRLTGDARNRHQPWFQIMDPASSRFVSKAEYHRIRPGWRACLVKEAVERGGGANHVEATRGIPQSVATDAVRTIGGRDFRPLWFATLVVAPWLLWWMLDDYLGRRKAVLIVMRHFADRFVRELERPLIQQRASARPLRSRFRFSPHRARLEILLAPGAGRRYPNLSDHKKNVEYDVARVLRVLADESFVIGALYTQAGWVVVPFHLRVSSKQTGVPCISSF